MSPIATLAAIAAIALLFALAAGGTLAGLSALETLLEHRGTPKFTHPYPLLSGPPR